MYPVVRWSSRSSTGHRRDTRVRAPLPRSVRASQLETRTARLKLRPAKKPVFVKIGVGLALGYRRNLVAGTWVARVADGRGGNWTKKIGIADDFDEADEGHEIFDFWGAQDRARVLVRTDSN